MYKLTNTGMVQQVETNTFFPMVEGNPDYQDYLLWLEEGNTPEPADVPSLLDLQEAVWLKIKEHRDTLQVAGCEVAGFWFHNDLKSRSQWERMANRSQKLLNEGAQSTDYYTINGAPVQWKTMSGAFTPLTLEMIHQVVNEFELQEARLFVAAETHKALMRASEDPTSYDYSENWPPVFEG